MLQTASSLFDNKRSLPQLLRVSIHRLRLITLKTCKRSLGTDHIVSIEDISVSNANSNPFKDILDPDMHGGNKLPVHLDKV